MSTKNKFLSVIIIIMGNFIALETFFRLYKLDGFLDSVIVRENVVNMFIEIIIYIIILLQISYFAKGIKVPILYAITILIFSYSHFMLLPIIFSGLYMFQIYLLGKSVLQIFHIKINRFSLSWTMGAVSNVIVYAIMSLLKIASINNIRIYAVASFFILFIIYLYRYRLQEEIIFLTKIGNSDIIIKILFCFIIGFFLLRVGQAPISIDYDSAWYGLRSAFVLDPVSGIYDKAIFVGTVYTYSKGFEILALPMAFIKTYGFMYAFNICIGAMILVEVYYIARLFVNRKDSIFIVAMVSSLASVMNMTITAKPDIITLLFQLICIYYSILFIQNKETNNYYFAFSCFIFSLALKPTSFIFSTSVFGIIILYRVYLLLNKKVSIDIKNMVVIIISLIGLFFVWLRTYMLLGIPATSVMTGIFEKIGFTANYPYTTGLSGRYSNFKNISDVFTKDNFIETLLEIKNYYLGPHIGKMDHVILAWGTSLPTFLLLVVLLLMLFNYKKIKLILNDKRKLYMFYLLVIEQLAIIGILMVGTGYDGNYFMLPNVISIISSSILIVSILDGVSYNFIYIKYPIYVFLLLNMVIIGTTNWSWVSGFKSISWNNPGYYDNEKAFYETLKKDYGLSSEIYKTMTEDKLNRVMMFAMHSLFERIPCMAETELDITYWGNDAIFENVDTFTEYLDYVDCDYIFVQSSYLTEDSKGYDFIVSMINTGIITDIITDDSGNILLIYKGSDKSNKNIYNEFIEAIHK